MPIAGGMWLGVEELYKGLCREKVMKKFMKRMMGIALVVVLGVSAWAEETKEQKDARMAWWREAKFGMFIHWGVYAVPAGTYDGKQIGGIGEWIMNRGKIPVARYAEYAKEFNPVKFNADEWVKLAKDAGMKYVVITSKHHDGFAMFPSKASPYNLHDATPFKRDPLAELAAACRKHGIKLGFYYSQAQDWYHPGGAAAGGHWDKAQDGSMDEYIDKIAVPQVREILSNYGEFPAILWWDTPTGMNKERAAKLHKVVEELKPNIILNNRLGGGFKGDTETPEQHIPATGYKNRDWETCMTMNDTWGFKSYDHRWKSTQVLLRNLLDIVSKGGNYLLNVGPTAGGLIPEPSIERLREVGAWMKVNGSAIYGMQASPFKRLPFNGRCTQKPGTLFLHVFERPADGRITLPINNPITRVSLLADRSQTLKVEDQTILLPEKLSDPIATVVVVEITGAPAVITTSTAINQAADGRLILGAADSEIVGDNANLEEKGGKPNIGYWTDAGTTVKWQVNITQPGAFNVVVSQACEADTAGTGYELIVGTAKVAGKVEATSGWEDFRNVTLGQLKLDTTGKHVVEVKPTGKPKFAVMNLRAVTLQPAHP